MKKSLIAAGICLLLFLGISIAEMIREGEPITLEVMIFELAEAIVIFGAVALTSLTAIEAREMHRERLSLINKVETAQFDGTQWRSLAENYIAGLGAAISRQFEAWNFTSSEADIAMLMLKGFSHKDIASLRNTSEATVRQQASSIYRKSKLHNHREFSAYFLEDLTASVSGPEELAARDVNFELQAARG